MKWYAIVWSLILSIFLLFGEASAQNHLLVLNKAGNSVWQLNADTGEKVAEYSTNAGPHEVAISPGGNRALITNYGGVTPGHSLTLVDLVNREVVKTIDLDPYQRPHGVEWFTDGNRAIVTTEAQKTVIIVDVESGNVTTSIKTNQLVTHMVTLNRANDRAYATSIGSGSTSILDLDRETVIKTINTGAGTEGLALLESRGELWVTNRDDNTVSIIDIKRNEIVQTLKSTSFPIRAALSPGGEWVTVSNGQSSEVAIFDASSKEKIATISTMTSGDSETVPIGMVFSEDGSRLFVSNSEADQVVVIDTSQWEMIQTFKTGDTPDGIAYF